MHNPAKLKKENLHYALVQKLDPVNFPKMSSVMAAVLGFLLDVTFIEPRIVEIAVTTDGFVLARPEGDRSSPHYLGRYVDLLRGWSRLVGASGLTQAERIEAECLFASRIGYFGRVGA